MTISNDTLDIAGRGRQDMMITSRLTFDAPTRGPLYSDAYSEETAATTLVGVNAYQYINKTPFQMESSAHAPGLSLPPLKQRRVYFAAGHKVINEGPEESISEEEMQVRWWTQDDLDDIKQAAKEMSIRLRRQAKERGCYVEMAHKKTSLMLCNNFQELVKLTPSAPDQDLRHWCARSDGRRGLERFASKEYGNLRKDDVIQTREAVLQEQERQRQETVFCPEQMAKVSKEKSRRARTFSLFMGEADAQAAARENSSSAAATKRARVGNSSTSPQQPPQQQQRITQRNQMPAESAQSRDFASVETPMLQLAAWTSC